MWEWNYAKEPFDMKLLFIRLIKNIWIPVVAALLGAAIVGGGYFLVVDVFGGPDTYEMTSTYYVEYGKDPETGNDYTYINHASWDVWIKSDYFVDNIWTAALDGGLNPEQYGIEKQDLVSFLFADLPSDLRMPISVVTTGDAKLTALLGVAVEKAFLIFPQDQKEIESIKVVDTTDVTVSDKNIRTFRACVLGAVLGAFFALVVMLLCYIADDSIYLPKVFSCRYGIPALGGTADCGGALHLVKGTAENVNYIFRDCKTVGITSVEEETNLKAVEALLCEADKGTDGGNAAEPKEHVVGRKVPEYVCIPSVLQVPEAAEKLRAMDGILLLTAAGAKNGKLIESALHQLKVQDCDIKGVLLTDMDENLLKVYELTGFRGKSK